MTKRKVVFVAEVKQNVSALYLVGSSKELGEWDLTKATSMSFDAEKNAYTVAKMLPEDTQIEYKYVCKQEWQGVEKGMFKEEIVNHTGKVEKNAVLDVVIYNFAE